MTSCMLELVVGFRSHGLICLSKLSGPNVVSRPQIKKLWNFSRFHGFNESNWWFLIKWGLACEIGGRVLELWLDTPFGPKWPKCSFYAPDPKVTTFLDILWFYWKQVMITDQVRPCMWRLVGGFRNYGLIGLLGPSGTKVASRLRTTNLQSFFRFLDFNESNLQFVTEWGPLCEKWW